MATDGVPITMHVVGNVHTYEIYPLCTSVGKSSVAGEIVAMKSALPDEPGDGVQTTYTVYYEDGEEEEDLTHEQITERIRNRP